MYILRSKGYNKPRLGYIISLKNEGNLFIKNAVDLSQFKFLFFQWGGNKKLKLIIYNNK